MYTNSEHRQYQNQTQGSTACAGWTPNSEEKETFYFRELWHRSLNFNAKISKVSETHQNFPLLYLDAIT